MKGFRIGQGYDVHALAEELPLILGGVQVPYAMGCVAHSDGDVLIHAICDALLGALAKGDIGLHFPDTDPAYKGVDSRLLLRRTLAMVVEEGYSIVNVDATVIMQQPKLRPYIDSMRASLAATMDIDVDCVSVKATTTEHLGFEGEGLGVAAMAIVLIEKV